MGQHAAGPSESKELLPEEENIDRTTTFDVDVQVDPEPLVHVAPAAPTGHGAPLWAWALLAAAVSCKSPRWQLCPAESLLIMVTDCVGQYLPLPVGFGSQLGRYASKVFLRHQFEFWAYLGLPSQLLA